MNRIIASASSNVKNIAKQKPLVYIVDFLNIFSDFPPQKIKKNNAM